MKKVFQSKDDDCFAASLASLLEIPVKKVPDFADVPDQLQAAQRWLRRKGYNMVEFEIPKTVRRGKWPWSPQDTPVYCMLTVSWQGGQWHHAVVGRLHKSRLKIIHDPCPDKDAQFGKRYRFCRVAFIVPRESTRMHRRPAA